MKFIITALIAGVFSLSAFAQNGLNMEFEQTLKAPETGQLLEEFKTEFKGSNPSEIASECAAVFTLSGAYLGQNHEPDIAKDAQFIALLFIAGDLAITALNEGKGEAVAKADKLQENLNKQIKEISRQFEDVNIIEMPVIFNKINTCMKGVLYSYVQHFDKTK